ncbi:GNAT family N-acetyltransferase [Terribacillus halophilus]|uniref:GNAT family N-acetyltransferase n=1 Tax=Terribacillus halophilus TaxID=361279 RepID=UPI0009862E29|nr:GNAT family N-acetyltransferase [Terribacillus halophilus]
MMTAGSNHIDEIACLLMEGFSGKFHHLKLPIHEQETAFLCLAEHIVNFHSSNLVIKRDEIIQGLLFIKPRRWIGTELTKQLLKQLRLTAFLKTIAFLFFLDHRCKNNELHIDFLVVAASSRGKGIGAQLIQTVKSQMDSSQHLTLFVSAHNNAARRLYEKQDFLVSRKGKSKTGGRFHGIKEWYFMEWRGEVGREKGI